MSCSCTVAAISARSGLRSTFAVSWSWSACSQAGTCATSAAAAVDRPVPVPDQLARLAARGGEAETHEDVVEAALEDPQQVLAGDAGLARRLVVVAAELRLEHAVVAAGLLLLAALHPVLGRLLGAAAG